MTATFRKLSAVGQCLLVIAFVLVSPREAKPAEHTELAKKIAQLSPDVFADDEQATAREKLRIALRSQLQRANDASRREWLKVESRKQWQDFREQRIAALKNSLGDWPTPPKEIRKIVASSEKGDGFTIENIIYQSRPHWWVTANLYRPATPPAKMPGIIISHSHHRPKEHGELQDMGMTWARAGCLVLVPDHLGHGERGQHGLKSADDFPRDFAVSRQDYYFRYDNSIQLYLAGDSLMGWMAWDLMRGVDVLLQEEGIDKEKIILLGAVAGGGDPCAVTAALDERITCAVPFNFGGPQPETRYPLPEDAETSFNYAGSGGWESTRNLAYSAADDSRFLPWEIVASIAPRRLIFAHEFSWHREADPVWKRLKAVYDHDDTRDHLAFAHGRGELRGSSPEASHCTHIGKFHRVKIHQALDEWFDIHVEEYSHPIETSKLHAGAALGRDDIDSQLLCQLLDVHCETKLQEARTKADKMLPLERRSQLRTQLELLLGNVAPRDIIRIIEPAHESFVVDDQTYRVARQSINDVPVLILLPDEVKKPHPLVIGLAQGGKAGFLKHRSQEIAKLLAAGVTVCLPDVRGVGELAGDDSHGRSSAATAHAATALMVGDPLVAQQLRDVREVLMGLDGPVDESGGEVHFAIWADSFVPRNDANANFRVPRRIDGRPHEVDPWGGTLALLTALYEDDIRAVYIHRGLADFQGALDSPFVYIPLDSVIPGLLNYADLPDIAAALAPRPLQLSGMVDAYNRPLSRQQTSERFAITRAAYKKRNAAMSLHFPADDASPAEWLIEQLK